MSVTLQPLTEDNWRECIDLAVAEDQFDFVASNVYSIAQTRFEPTWAPLAIYAHDTMVGFIMYDAADYYITRLMIDVRYQGRGYGRGAMEQLLDRMGNEYALPTATTSYVPGNTAAEKLYLSLDFEKTGEIVDGEIVVRRQLQQKKA